VIETSLLLVSLDGGALNTSDVVDTVYVTEEVDPHVSRTW
jgi:hypothetical protein